jgi:hypothetical protein
MEAKANTAEQRENLIKNHNKVFEGQKESGQTLI